MAVTRSVNASGTPQAGFSLIEVVVVVAIIGVSLALAFNGRSMLADRRLTGMARNMSTDFRMIEQRARTERTCYRIDFDPAGETYTIYKYDNTAPGAITQGAAGSGPLCSNGAAWGTTPAIAEASGDTVSRRMPSGIDLVSTTFAANVLTMSPMGNGNAGTVTIRSTGGAQRLVVFEPFGRVTIQP